MIQLVNYSKGAVTKEMNLCPAFFLPATREGDENESANAYCSFRRPRATLSPLHFLRLCEKSNRFFFFLLRYYYTVVSTTQGKEIFHRGNGKFPKNK